MAKRGFLRVGMPMVLFLGLTASPGAVVAQGFDGITVIKLGQEAGANAIRGRPDIGATKTGDFIVAFVSPQGSYAALVGVRLDRGCAAWAVPGSHTAEKISFGLPASTATMTTVTPKVCQPFTLTHDGPETVRIDADNKFSNDGPLAPAAQPLHYSARHPIAARIPLRSLPWDMPIFAKHDVKGIRLGPAATAADKLKGEVEAKIGPLRLSPLGSRRDYQARLTKQRNQFGNFVVNGHVAPAAIVGGTEDVLYAAWIAERFDQAAPTETFEQVVAERYGKASQDASQKGSPVRLLIWNYDLDGRQMGPEGAKPPVCLPIEGLWSNWGRENSLESYSGDIGPWGCSLVMMLNYNSGGTVTEYRVEAVSGYALALNQMAMRMREMQEAQQKIRDLEATKPRL